jgi:hypothetical protein
MRPRAKPIFASAAGASDSTRIDSERNLYDEETGENIGNIFDEAGG